MSKGQKFFLTIGLLFMAVSALFPPKYHIGQHSVPARRFLYSWRFDSPQSIHLQKLVVEWMFLGAATGALMVISKGRPDEEANGIVEKTES